MKYWLFKSEPNEYSINTLRSEGTGTWDGIRNYQARNFIREMKEGDLAFLYHSSCKTPGIFGSMKIIGTPYPDAKALDRTSKYFDPKCTVDSNAWLAIDVQFEEEYVVPLLLSCIKTLELGSCPLTAKGNRLSVIPLTSEQHQTLREELEKLNGR